MNLMRFQAFVARFGFLIVGLAVVGAFRIAAAAESSEEEEGVRGWQELAVQFPAPPRQENLQQFYVSAATDNAFFVDGSTLTVGDDGVVRYVLVIQTQGGARNVTFEGVRCDTRERRIYASGRADGSWSKARNGEWKKIEAVAANRYHAALFFEYFCSDGTIVRNADEARDALRRGGRSGQIPRHSG